MHCILMSCLHLKKTIHLPCALPLPAEISAQQTHYTSDYTANPFMSVPHLFMINSFSFHNIPCIVARGIHRHQLQLSEVNLHIPSTANERRKDPFKNDTTIPIKSPSRSHRCLIPQAVQTILYFFKANPNPSVLLCLKKTPKHNAVEAHPVTVKQRPS